MLRRLLNIASILSLVACVAFMGMWVRSYWWCDELISHYTDTQVCSVLSVVGKVWLQSTDLGPVQLTERKIISVPIGNRKMPEFPVPPLPLGFSTTWGFQAEFSWASSTMIVPYWFLVLTIGSLAMVSQFRWPWRFTLRTLFIATTFLAIVLGMIAWLDHSWIGK
jgi:hypothetical protein